MTPEEQKIFDEYQTMFALPAWKKFMDSVVDYRKVVIEQTPYKVESELDLGVVKGSVQAFDMIIGLEATMSTNATQEPEPEGEEL